MKPLPLAALLAGFLCTTARVCSAQAQAPGQTDLWNLARREAPVHRYSTLFTAHDVRDHLSSAAGLQKATEWCKRTGVTQVYVESFRDGYQADQTTLATVRDAFRAAGLGVSGCVTTTRVGKPSTGWKEVACCYTDPQTQNKLQTVFEYTAGLFDEIMIDDFWFTDCACPECDRARLAKTVTVGNQTFAVRGDNWEDYRCELMSRLSQERVIGPAKRVNPAAKLIIKYPQWYDNFHVRGYEVSRESAAFDRIWVGTETRDYEDKKWGGTPQYEAYFIMRWLGGIGGSKCGGGWFDPYGTTPSTYIEQARQTVLGGARESVLFCYGSLQNGTGPQNVESLRTNLPELLATARQVSRRQIVGLAAYKPSNSPPGKEPRAFDFVGMLGIPLVPCHEFPAGAAAAFFSMHALKDPDLVIRLKDFLSAGKRVLMTDGLAQALTNQVDLSAPNVQVLALHHNPKSLLELDEQQLNDIRKPLLQPFRCSFRAPNRVALYLFSDGSVVIENFRDEAATVNLNGKSLNVPARGWWQDWRK
jgi:hypothetical protein